MMMMTNNSPFMNIAAMMAEDAGTPELRNPLNSAMQSRGLLSRLLDKIARGLAK